MIIFTFQFIYGQDSPAEFEFNQSTLQAFYFFEEVTLNGVDIEPDDWVAAFNGDICVGARVWDTSECGGGICDVPAMGDDGDENQLGYMEIGDSPTFKIYDNSTGIIYPATSYPTVDPWLINGITMNDLLIGGLLINPADFQYNGSITSEVHLNGVAIGTENDMLAAFVDGAIRGVANGIQSPFGNIVFPIMVYSNETSGETINFKFSDSSLNQYIEILETIEFTSDMTMGTAVNPIILTSDFCNDVVDCTGECGGTAVVDCAGECDGSSVEDCADECNGTAVVDCAGECDGSSVEDCADECNGTAELDCAGACGGTAVEDECTVPVCSGGETGLVANASCTDCNGNVNGTADLDGCSECVGGETGLEACPQDCAGIDGGSASWNECNTCICNGSEALEGFECIESEVCIAGCDGFWNNDGSASILDDCQVCGGDGTSCMSIDNHITESFSINSIYPNPFNPVVNIDLSIDIVGYLQLSVFTVEGIQIKTIYSGPSSIGESTFTWRPENRASGFYFVSAVIENQVKTQKVLFLK